MSSAIDIESFLQTLNDLPAVHELVVDLPAHQVRLDGKPLRLTTQEFRLLHRLALTPGRPVGRRQLREALWGHATRSEGRTVDAYAASLRAAIPIPSLISTVRGVGYCLNQRGPGDGSAPFQVVIRSS